MTHWTTDVHGNRFFNHAGWTVRIWTPEWASTVIRPGWASGRITVEAPHTGEEVEVHDDGIWVRGEDGMGGWEGPGPRAFVIPWGVMTAIIEARAIVG